MHRRIRSSAVVVALTATAALLAACGAPAEEQAEAITFWTPQSTPERVAAQEAVAAQFTEETGIEVEVVPMAAADQDQALVTGAASGDVPDVILAGASQATSWQSQGLLDTDVARPPSTRWTRTRSTRTRSTRSRSTAQASARSQRRLDAPHRLPQRPARAGGRGGADHRRRARGGRDHHQGGAGHHGHRAGHAGRHGVRHGGHPVDLPGGGLPARVRRRGRRSTRTSAPRPPSSSRSCATRRSPATSTSISARAAYLAATPRCCCSRPTSSTSWRTSTRPMPPTCEECADDPTFLAENSGFITVLDEERPGAVRRDPRLRRSPPAPTRDEAQQYIEYVLGDGYVDTLAVATEGRIPLRNGTAEEPDRVPRRVGRPGHRAGGRVLRRRGVRRGVGRRDGRRHRRRLPVGHGHARRDARRPGGHARACSPSSSTRCTTGSDPAEVTRRWRRPSRRSRRACERADRPVTARGGRCSRSQRENRNGLLLDRSVARASSCLVVLLPFALVVVFAFSEIRLVDIPLLGDGADRVDARQLPAGAGHPGVLGRPVDDAAVRVASRWSGRSAVGLVLALALRRPFRGRGLVRALLLVPYVLPGHRGRRRSGRRCSTRSTAWSTRSAARYLGWDSPVGLPQHHHRRRLGHPRSRCRCSSSCCSRSGSRRRSSFLFITARLQAVPAEIEEAAALDGANGCQILGRIVLPQLRAVILLLLLLRFIWSFQSFNESTCSPRAPAARRSWPSRSTPSSSPRPTSAAPPRSGCS